jgi:hypothetical protein
MSSSPSNFIDLFNLALHRAVAEKLRQDAKPVLQIARNNLNRWLKKSENFALLEWRQIIETRSPEEIIKIISQDTDEGQRLRSSSPFAGVVSEVEREKIWSECAEIRPV